MANKITCTCGHSWNKSDSSKNDATVCHICGKNNMKDGGWLDKYEEGGQVDKYKTLPEVIVKSSKKKTVFPQPKVDPAIFNNDDPKWKEQPYEPSQAVKNTKAALTALQIAGNPTLRFPAGIANAVFDAGTATKYLLDSQYKNAAIDAGEALVDLIPMMKGMRSINISKTATPTPNIFSPLEKAWNKGVQMLSGAANLDNLQDAVPSSYEQGGLVLKQKTKDNYGKKPNLNDVQASMPPGFVGMGNNTKGRDYSPAWGGQFQTGGFLQPNDYRLPSGIAIPNRADIISSELATSIGGEDGEPAYLIPSFKGGRRVNALEEYKKTGEHLGGPFKTWQEAEEWERDVRHPYVEKGQSIPTPIRRWGKDFEMGGSLPGSVGFTYARTQGSAPANGKYTKKTLASAQNGQEMSYYQHGLDFKTKGMKNGGWLDKYDEEEIVKDDMGYWNPDNHGKVVEIGSPYITMEGVDQPLIGISDEGDKKYMTPGKNYKFKGKKVREYPVAKNGLRQEQKGLQNLDDLTNFTNYNTPQAAEGMTVDGDPIDALVSASKKVGSSIMSGLSSVGSGLMSGFNKLEDLISGAPSKSSVSTTTPPPQVNTPLPNTPWDDMRDFYNEKHEVYKKTYNKSNVAAIPENDSNSYITLDSGRFRGAKIPTAEIDDLAKRAKTNQFPLGDMLALMGRESTYGGGSGDSKNRAGSKEGLVSGWTNAEKYEPLNYAQFLADKKVPGIEKTKYKTRTGTYYDVEKVPLSVINYVEAHPKLVEEYKKKVANQPVLGDKNAYDLAMERIKKSGFKNYNPGDPNYTNLIEQDKKVLQNSTVLMNYLKSKGYQFKNGGWLDKY